MLAVAFHVVGVVCFWGYCPGIDLIVRFNSVVWSVCCL